MARKSSKSVVAITGAFIYLRVSTGKQAESGLGMDAQEARCRAHCEHHGLEVLGVFRDDGRSGKDEIASRPGIQAAVDAVAANPHAILVVHSLSRLARRQRVIWNLLDPQGGIALRMASATEPFETTTAMGRAFLGMLGTFAQLEADLASERTTVALAAAVANGTILGGPRFGTKVVVRDDATTERVICDEEFAVLRQIREMYATERWSYRTLADELNVLGVPTKRGGRWHHRTVMLALRGAKDLAA